MPYLKYFPQQETDTAPDGNSLETMQAWQWAGICVGITFIIVGVLACCNPKFFWHRITMKGKGREILRRDPAAGNELSRLEAGYRPAPRTVVNSRSGHGNVAAGQNQQATSPTTTGPQYKPYRPKPHTNSFPRKPVPSSANATSPRHPRVPPTTPVKATPRSQPRQPATSSANATSQKQPKRSEGSSTKVSSRKRSRSGAISANAPPQVKPLPPAPSSAEATSQDKALPPAPSSAEEIPQIQVQPPSQSSNEETSGAQSEPPKTSS